MLPTPLWRGQGRIQKSEREGASARLRAPIFCNIYLIFIDITSFYDLMSMNIIRGRSKSVNQPFHGFSFSIFGRAWTRPARPVPPALSRPLLVPATVSIIKLLFASSYSGGSDVLRCSMGWSVTRTWPIKHVIPVSLAYVCLGQSSAGTWSTIQYL